MVSDILVFKVQLVYRDSAVKWLHYQKYWTGFSFYVGYFEESSWEQIINDEEVKIWAGFFSLRGKRKGNKRNPLDGCSKTCMGKKKQEATGGIYATEWWSNNHRSMEGKRIVPGRRWTASAGPTCDRVFIRAAPAGWENWRPAVGANCGHKTT